eukprot:gene17674-biopygen6849
MPPSKVAVAKNTPFPEVHKVVVAKNTSISRVTPPPPLYWDFWARQARQVLCPSGPASSCDSVCFPQKAWARQVPPGESGAAIGPRLGKPRGMASLGSARARLAPYGLRCRLVLGKLVCPHPACSTVSPWI